MDDISHRRERVGERQGEHGVIGFHLLEANSEVSDEWGVLEPTPCEPGPVGHLSISSIL
jgi:hypothetical protein